MIQLDGLGRPIDDVAHYDLYLFRDLSNKPWDDIQSTGIRWLYLLPDQSMGGNVSSDPETSDWIVALDHQTLVTDIPGLTYSHGRVRRLFPLVRSKAHFSGLDIHLPDLSFITALRAELYGRITSERILDKIPLLYSPESYQDSHDPDPIVSRHILHRDNQRAVNRIEEYIVTNYRELVERGDLRVVQEPMYDESVAINNLVIEFTGNSTDTICIGAHVDSTAASDPGYKPSQCPAPGIHDNASGVIGALCCIDLFAHFISEYESSKAVLKRTIRIVLFNGEEAGLLGSQRHLNWAAARGDRIIGAYCMDMIGHPGINSDKSRLVELHWGSSYDKTLEPHSKKLADFFSQVALEVSEFVTFEHFGGYIQDPAENRSDHASFHLNGVPAFNAGHDFFPFGSGDPHYHTAEDTELDADYCANVARTVAACTWGMATVEHGQHHPPSHGHSHGHGGKFVGSEHSGHHAMIIVGDQHLYLCHMINMGMAAHHYHYIIKVRLDDHGMREYLRIKGELNNQPLNDCLMVGNLLPFRLSDIYLGRIRSYEAGIWTARPPESFVLGMAWPWAKQEPLAKINVHIERVVHFRRFSSADNYPSELTYILFGNEHEAFLQHNQTKQPDFDHILKIKPPDELEPDFLACANTVRVGGLLERPGGKLRCAPPLNNGDRNIALSFDFASRAVTTDVIENIWFSTDVVNIGYKGVVC